MKSALQVHPSWFGAEGARVSDTWRWFHLERWLGAVSADALQTYPVPKFDMAAPSDYASILRNALWIVAEAMHRDGVSRGQLTADDMRWARRLGLALMGDGPMSGLDDSAPLGTARTERSDAVAAHVMTLFPEADQSILYWSLRAPSEYGGLPRLARRDGAHVPQSALVARPEPASPKLAMLVRLAKRHVAARFGVDLRESEPQTPVRMSAGTSAEPTLSPDVRETERTPPFLSSIPPQEVEMRNAG